MAGSDFLTNVVRDCIVSIESQNHGKIRGTVVGVDANKTCLTLKNITNTLNDGKEIYITDKRNYFSNDINALQILEKHEEIIEKVKDINISENENSDIDTTAKNYVYIDKINDIYKDAIEDLKSYPYIALQGECGTNEDLSNFHLLTISTPTKIYIYDLHSIGHIDEKLKQVLEKEDWPKKIMHDCRVICKFLSKTHGISLNGVFDTQIIDQQIRLKDDPAAEETDLSTCMTTYLGIDHNIISPTVSGNILYPLSEDYKLLVAKNISYMHLLSEKQYNIIMEPIKKLNDFTLNHNIQNCYTEDYANYEDTNLTDLYDFLENL